MRRLLTRITLMALVALMGITVIACDLFSGGEPTPSATVPPPARSTPVVKPLMTTNSGPVSTTSSGFPVNSSTGNIPVYPGATNLTAYDALFPSGANGSTLHVYTTPDSKETVFTYYKETLQKAGYYNITSSGDPQMGMSGFSLNKGINDRVTFLVYSGDLRARFAQYGVRAADTVFSLSVSNK